MSPAYPIASTSRLSSGLPASITADRNRRALRRPASERVEPEAPFLFPVAVALLAALDQDRTNLLCRRTQYRPRPMVRARASKTQPATATNRDTHKLMRLQMLEIVMELILTRRCNPLSGIIEGCTSILRLANERLR